MVEFKTARAEARNNRMDKRIAFRQGQRSQRQDARIERRKKNQAARLENKALRVQQGRGLKTAAGIKDSIDKALAGGIVKDLGKLGGEIIPLLL